LKWRRDENADVGAGAGGANLGVIPHLLTHKVDTALWLTRLLTVLCGFLFIIPFIGGDPVAIYQRIFLSAAATSALRLHQRAARPITFSREFLGSLVLEDSCHYLFFSLIFYHTSPVTLAVLPVLFFALLHAGSFTTEVLDKIGPQAMQPIRALILKIRTHQTSLLRFIASAEIFLFPTSLFLALTGKGGLVLPFFYYRFLTLRYASRRNPYCRTVFWELRVSLEQLSRHPSCPGFVRNMVERGIATVSRFAPTLAQA